MASKKKGKKAERASSNVFAMFSQTQIQEFKEAFNMIDQDHDGFISKSDLSGMLQSFGKEPKDSELEEMINDAPGAINFTMFLTMMGEKMTGTDPEDTILSAFKLLDEENTGLLDEDNLRRLLTCMGDRLTDDEVDQTYRGAPIDKAGNFDYKRFVHIVKYGAEDET